LRLKSDMKPAPVLRLGAYHDSAWQEGFASATAVRGALLRGDWAAAERMVPGSAFPLLAEAFAAGRVHRPQALDLLLRDRLRDLTAASLRQYPNVGEGFEYRLLRLQAEHTSREGLLTALKTKRYTHARLNRLLTHILLDMTKDRLAACQPQSFRLLAFRDSARPYLSSLPPGLLYTKPARQARNASFLLDMAAYDLWALGAGLPLGEGYRQQVGREG
jgi:predicted nucleotidyltransferase